MKKLTLIIMALILVLALTACGSSKSSELKIDSNEDNTVTINADKASKESGGTANIEVGEGEKIAVTPFLKEGKISVIFFEPDNYDEAVADVTAESSDETVIELDAGKYDIRVTVLEDAEGTVTVSTKAS